MRTGYLLLFPLFFILTANLVGRLADKLKSRTVMVLAFAVFAAAFVPMIVWVQRAFEDEAAAFYIFDWLAVLAVFVYDWAVQGVVEWILKRIRKTKT